MHVEVVPYPLEIREDGESSHPYCEVRVRFLVVSSRPPLRQLFNLH